MGAWGVGYFENDSALDWIDEIIHSEDAFQLLVDIAQAYRIARGCSNRGMRTTGHTLACICSIGKTYLPCLCIGFCFNTLE